MENPDIRQQDEQRPDEKEQSTPAADEAAGAEHEDKSRQELFSEKRSGDAEPIPQREMGTEREGETEEKKRELTLRQQDEQRPDEKEQSSAPAAEEAAGAERENKPRRKLFSKKRRKWCNYFA